MRYQPQVPLYAALIAGFLGGCEKQPSQLEQAVQAQGLPISGTPRGRLVSPEPKVEQELDLATPVKSLATFERAILEKNVDAALACVYRPELFEAGYTTQERERVREEVKQNLLKDWINDPEHWHFIEQKFGSYEKFVDVIEQTGEAMYNAPLRYDKNVSWAKKFGHRTSRVKATHDSRSGTLRADMFLIKGKWYVGDW